MLAALDTLPADQVLALCGFGPVAILAVAFIAYDAAGFVRLAWRGQ